MIAKGRETARDVWKMVDEKIAKHPWAAGENYSVADAYAFVFWTWGRGKVFELRHGEGFSELHRACAQDGGAPGRAARPGARRDRAG